MFVCASVVAVVVCCVITRSRAGHFPVNCFSDDMDVMFLYFDGSNELAFQRQLGNELVQHLVSFPSNKTRPRVMFAEVYDLLSVGSYADANVSSWKLSSTEADPYRLRDTPMNRQYNSFETIVEMKIQFVNRLFSEMDGVRDNATHIAVVFVNAYNLQYNEWSKLGDVLQDQPTDIKIFVVGLYGLLKLQIIYQRDTLLLGIGYNREWTQILSLAICNQCQREWFSFVQSDSTDFLSCYKLVQLDFAINSDTAGKLCQIHGGFLATIESLKEISFLRELIYERLRHLSNDLNSVNVSVHIGLRGDKSSVAKKFQWFNDFQNQYRPVLLDNWKPGEPSLGHSGGCGIWQFTWDEAGFSGSEGAFVDGWIDVGCEATVSTFYLCEAVLPREIDYNSLTRLQPASEDSFTRAMSRGNFMNFHNKIAAVSSHISDKHFSQLLEQHGRIRFPLFDCGEDAGEPRYISYMYVCDNTNHCSNGLDETVCAFEHETSRRPEHKFIKKCDGVYCCDGSCLPLARVNDMQVDCAVFMCGSQNETNDEYNLLNMFMNRNETCAFICNNKCIHFSQLNDSREDCSGPDGPVDEILGQLETADTCRNILGQKMWAPKCIYVTDKHGAILGCRNMSHIRDCEDFECPSGYFKCPKSYCIPQHYVLDGNPHCPSGQDEQFESPEYCVGNFECWHSKMCLHPDKVCDGQIDCPQRDDEIDCDVSCLEGFLCESGTLTISDYTSEESPKSFNVTNTGIRLIDMSGLDLSSLQNISFLAPGKLLVILWSNCQISQLNNRFTDDLNQVYKLDLSHNLFESFTITDIWMVRNTRNLNLSKNRQLANLHITFHSLETLDLSFTGLSYLDDNFQVWLPKLSVLNLSYSQITRIYKNTFSPKSVLQTLDLRGIIFETFWENFYNGLSITQNLYTDSFELCCPQVKGVNISSDVCQAPDNSISSCSDLLRFSIQRVFLLVAAVLAVFGNFAVIVYRMIFDRSVLKTGYGLFVTNLGISDFIMGIYLCIIAGADYSYRGDYILYDKAWRESIVCKLTGFLATLSCEASTFFIFFISLDRFLKIKFPFGQVTFTKASKIVSLVSCWLLGLLLALIPIIFKFETYSTNAMCLGLPLTAQRATGWEFSFGVFVVLNCSLSLAIVYGQRAIFRALLANRIDRTAISKNPRRAEDIVVAKQLFLVAMTNLLCWFPVGVLGILSLGGRAISNHAYAWTIVVVTPINSAANPLLYTIPALMDRWEKFKSAGSHSTSTCTKNIVKN